MTGEENGDLGSGKGGKFQIREKREEIRKKVEENSGF
jgi:hypothetical protein